MTWGCTERVDARSYADPKERSAFIHGYGDGYNGHLPLDGHPLVNAYSAEYREGAGDKSMDESNSERLERSFHEVVQGMASLVDAIGKASTMLEAVLARIDAANEPAPPVLDPTQPDPAKWKPWSGGFPPRPDDREVWIEQRYGQVSRALVGQINWRHFPEANYVVKWQEAV